MPFSRANNFHAFSTKNYFKVKRGKGKEFYQSNQYERILCVEILDDHHMGISFVGFNNQNLIDFLNSNEGVLYDEHNRLWIIPFKNYRAFIITVQKLCYRISVKLFEIPEFVFRFK